MGHSNSRIFEEHYLSRRVRHDVQAAYLRRPSEDALIEAAGRMSRSIDPRRPKTLSNDQLVQIGEHPKVLELSRSRALLCDEIILLHGKICKAKGTTIYTKYAQVGLALSGEKQYQKKVLLKHVRGIYCQEAPVNDIQKQLDGTPFLMDIDMDPITIALAERSRVAKAFFSGSIPLETEDHSRRAEAIKDLTALCALREVRHRYAAYQRGPPLNTDNEEPCLMEVDLLEDEPLEVGSGNGEPECLGCITLKCEPLQCIFCLGERSLGNH